MNGESFFITPCRIRSLGNSLDSELWFNPINPYSRLNRYRVSSELIFWAGAVNDPPCGAHIARGSAGNRFG